MATVIVQTDDGHEVWRMERIEPWHVFGKLSANGNVRASALIGGIVCAVIDADKVQQGIDPERLSEEAMRLSEMPDIEEILAAMPLDEPLTAREVAALVGAKNGRAVWSQLLQQSRTGRRVIYQVLGATGRYTRIS